MSTTHVHVSVHGAEEQKIGIREHPDLGGIVMLSVTSGPVDICFGGPAERVRDLAWRILLAVDELKLRATDAPTVQP